jgi:divalent metal cation (Fe/Co/Zn/Cd) transporter
MDQVETQSRLLRRGLLLEYATLGWNVVGTVIVVAAAIAAVLIGIALNALLDWWWADPVAALVIVYYGAKEGIAALRGHEA